MNNIVKSVVFAAVVLFAGIAAMQVIYDNQGTPGSDITAIEPASGESVVPAVEEAAAPAAEAVEEKTEEAAAPAAEAVEEKTEEAAAPAVDAAKEAVEEAAPAAEEETKAAE